MKDDILKKTARIISDTFIPPSFAVISFFYLCYNYSSTKNEFAVSFLITMFATVILPVIYFLIKRRRGEISNRDATIKEQRTGPFIFSMLLASAGSIALCLLNAPKPVIYFLTIYITSGILVIIINKFYKISIHSLSAAGAVGMLLFFGSDYAIICGLLLILVMSSRVRLKVHTVYQVFLGAGLGLVVSYFQLYLLTKFFG